MRIDPKYLKYRKHYILQSIYASISIFILTLILNDNPVLIASIGSTAFIVFAMPKGGKSFSGRKTGILTDNNAGNAEILEIETSRIKNSINLFQD